MTHDDLERESLHKDSKLAKWATKTVATDNRNIIAAFQDFLALVPTYCEDGSELARNTLSGLQLAQTIRATLEGCSSVVFKKDETLKETDALVHTISGSSSYLANLCREYDYTSSQCSILLADIRKYSYSRNQETTIQVSEFGMVKTCYVGEI